MLYVTELPEVFLALGTKLGLVLSFFPVKERSYGFEQELDVAIKVVMVTKDMVCKKDIDPGIHVCS